MELKSMEELRKIAEQEQSQHESAVENSVVANNSAAEQNLPTEITQKSITDLSVSDIKTTLDTSKSMEEQAEDIVGAMATAAAVQDEKTAEELKENKAKELKNKSERKVTSARTEKKRADKENQEAAQAINATIFKILSIYDDLPKWLQIILLPIATLLFILFSLVVGLPFGILTMTIDCIDSVIIRYENVDDKNKPKIKVTVWILLIAFVLGGAALIVLKCLGKI